MRTFTTTHTVYKFDELTDEAKAKAIESLYDINVDHDWWESVYEDANTIGLKIKSFDLYSHDIDGELTEDLHDVCDNILDQHGDTCSTHALAQKYAHRHGEDNDEQFLKELLEEYRVILQEDYDYRTSDEAIIETIDANDYEFYEDGRMV